jgi:glycosyltransferase involved in cell wall biosynthesis
MKRVAIFVNTLQSGGAEKQSIYLFNAIKTKYPTIFIVFHGDLFENKLLQLIDDNDYLIYKLEGNYLKKLLNIYNLLKSNQVTTIFTYLTKPNFIGSFIAQKAGVKYIYGSIRNSQLPKWKFLLEKIASEYFCTGTIFNNYEGEILFRKYGLKKTKTIPNCFPNINSPKTRSKKSIIKIITLGRFVEQKDYTTALKSITVLKEKELSFIFQIIGYGKLENQIRKEIAEYGLSTFVEIFINPDNIAELLEEADIYLSTSIFEGTSNSIMEAMNASLPIVATNVGDNNRMIFEGENGFLHHVGDYKEIAKSLETLMDDYNLRIKLGIRSNQILRENYSFKKFKESYIQLIEQE